MNRLSVADAARAALTAQSGGEAVVIATAIAPDGTVRRTLFGRTTPGVPGDDVLDARARRLADQLLHEPGAEPVAETVELDGHAWTLFVEAHWPREHLIVVGAGHIAVPVARLGRLLGFAVTVLDDREEFATADRFPDDVVVRQADFERDPFAGITINSYSYLALLTRGHRWDFDCLQRLLGTQARPRYIGMIGSRRRVRAAFQALLAAGTSRELLGQIHAPIGIEIRAETPEEIAVAIAAELVAVRRGAEIESISRRERVLERLLPEGATDG